MTAAAHPIRRAIYLVLGIVCLGLSVLALPIPVPLVSLAFFVAGVAFIAISVPAVRRWFAARRRNNKVLDDAMEKVEPIMPEEMREALAKDQPDDEPQTPQAGASTAPMPR